MSKTHDIFLLMLNLSQLTSTEQIIGLFIGAIKDAWPGLNLTYDSESTASGEVMQISTLRSRFGVLRIEKSFVDLAVEDQALVRNAVKMLAVVLENCEQAALLSREKTQLDEKIKQRSSELLEKDVKLETIDQELSTQIGKREQAEADRELFFNLSVDLLCIVGMDGYFRQMNPAWTEVLGWSKEELLANPWTDFVHHDDIEKIQNVRSTLAAGQTAFQFENRYRCQDGRYRTISWNACPLPDLELVFAVGRDVTEARRLAEQLLHSEKMQAVGQLAGGVAHDFNNQLAGILGYADLLREEILENPELTRYTDAIIRSVKRASDLTSQLLAFGRKGKFLSESVNCHRIIAEVVSLLERSVNKNILIKQILSANPPLTRGDPSQLQNAVLNIALNARDAMSDGGELIFATDTVYLDDRYCSESSFVLEPGNYLEMKVSDTGIGMEDRDRRQIFEPFFTTKAEGKGTGMGLSAVYGTVLNHQGAIQVHSELGQGTTVKLWLPLLLSAEDRDTDVTPALEPISGTATILVVDDDTVVCNLITEMLTRLGYTVHVCGDGAEAVAFYSDNWSDIDCVIIDMIMPVLGGKRTYLKMRDINPNLKALLSSGFSLDGVAQEILAAGANKFIQKPFRAYELSLAIAQTLGKVQI